MRTHELDHASCGAGVFTLQNFSHEGNAASRRTLFSCRSLRITAPLRAAVILIVISTGCSGSKTGAVEAAAYASLPDVPGVTEEEIRAVKALREKYDSLTFGALSGTEAFYDENGEIRGYSALFCEWLTELFGIKFIPKLYEWGDLFPALKADFAGDLTATHEREARLGYLFTGAIAERSTKIYHIAGSRPRSEIARTRPLRLAFLEGSTTSRAAEAKLRETAVPYEAAYINDYETAYGMMKSGEADAFIHEMVAEAAFDRMGDVVAEDFLPLIFEPVSLSTQNREFKPVIDVVQKVLEDGGISHFVDLYDRGLSEYARHRLFMRLDARELSYLRGNTTIKYLAEFDNYPVCFYNDNENQWQGIVPDILGKISALTGLTFEPVNGPGKNFSELLEMLENGEGAMLSELIRTSEREGRFLWTERDTMRDQYVAASLDEMPNITVNRIMQLRVGVQAGSAYAYLFSAWFPGHPSVVRYGDVDAAFDGLERGEVDILMCGMHNLLTAANYHERAGFKANLIFDYTFGSLLGFNKREKDLRSIVAKAMDVIDAGAISSQWMRKTFNYRSKIYESQRPYLIGVIVLFMTVIVLVSVLYLRNQNVGRTLDALVKQRTAELDGSRRDLSAALKAAEAANRAKSTFLATMSHEIRTPMNAIISMAEIALRGDIPDATSREHILTIKQAGTNLLSIINDILDFSKIEAGKLEVVPEDYLFSSLINDVISIIRIRNANQRVLFVVNVDSAVPDALFGDTIRIRQILLNLLSNAIKFTEKGFVSFTASGDIDGDAVTLVMTVEDSGRGMRKEDVGKLFQNFTQVDSAKNKGIVGTGLGLAITRNLAEAMGGGITVTSEYGKGSAFTVTLPQKIRDRKPLASVENPGEKHVLVYELREMYANSIVCTIDNLGVECALVSTESELRAKMESGSCNYIFIAANIYEGVRELCDDFGGRIKIVLLAGFGEAVANRNLIILEMPVYSTSVANILNGVPGGFLYYENAESVMRFTAPEAKVLIVDDIGSNLMVARGLLAPYGMRLTACNSGEEAITAASGEQFDLILMDHMMPGMDGIEAAGRIRSLGGSYRKDIPIVALTANAVSGAKDMFMEAGFADFLSKPIDVLKLDAILDRWIPREKRRKCVAENDGGAAASAPPEYIAAEDGELLEVFRREAEKAAATLRETAASGDIKLLTITAHAMKSALANIGEPEKSELAFALEQAGLRADREYIAANLESFLETLESLARSLIPPENPDKDGACVPEDGELLSRELAGIRAACAEYDEAAACAALDRLRERQWRADTAAALGDIRDMLFLHSDFEEAANRVDSLLQNLAFKDDDDGTH